jgi:hypothetical protein
MLQNLFKKIILSFLVLSIFSSPGIALAQTGYEWYEEDDYLNEYYEYDAYEDVSDGYQFYVDDMDNFPGYEDVGAGYYFYVSDFERYAEYDNINRGYAFYLAGYNQFYSY